MYLCQFLLQYNIKSFNVIPFILIHILTCEHYIINCLIRVYINAVKLMLLPEILMTILLVNLGVCMVIMMVNIVC